MRERGERENCKKGGEGARRQPGRARVKNEKINVNAPRDNESVKVTERSCWMGENERKEGIMREREKEK